MATIFTEKVAVLGAIDPGAHGTGTLGTGYVDMKQFDQLAFVVQVGVFESGAKVDFKLQEATSAAGAGVQDLSGKAITQLTAAGTDDDKQVIVVVKASELSDGYRFVRGLMTISVDAVDSGVLVLGADPRYMPASNFDVSTVDEIVY
ncbi:MAG: hypothetical protein ACOX5F_00820 [Anaerovoracaceae bacterium]|jgi:hypothetical protein